MKFVYGHKDDKISDSLEDRSFCLVEQDATVQLKQDHQYYYQVCYHGSSYCNLIYIIVPSSNFSVENDPLTLT